MGARVCAETLVSESTQIAVKNRLAAETAEDFMSGVKI
jgi:hypothetical protein